MMIDKLLTDTKKIFNDTINYFLVIYLQRKISVFNPCNNFGLNNLKQKGLESDEHTMKNYANQKIIGLDKKKNFVPPNTYFFIFFIILNYRYKKIIN
jgi:hypothetical protein